MEPTNAEMQAMATDRIASDIRMALRMKAQELVLECDDDRIYISNDSVSILTSTIIWVRMEGMSQVRVMGNTIGIYNDDYTKALHLESENIDDMFWDCS